MSKQDKLGPAVRALVGVPQENLATITKLCNRLGGRRGAEWRKLLDEAIETDLPPLVLLGEVLPMTYPRIRGVIDLREALKDHENDLWVRGIEDCLWPSSHMEQVSALYEDVPEVSGRYVDWINDGYEDEELVKKFAENFRFDFSEAVLRIAQLLLRQRGSRGWLKADGHANYFYTGDKLLRVHCNTRVPSWNFVSVGKSGGWGCSAGDRIFLPAKAVAPSVT